MMETANCNECCFKKIHSNVLDIEPLANHVYDDKDKKIDKMFGGQNFSYQCKDYVLYYECPSVHKVKYFCRLVDVYRYCTTKNNCVVHKICLSVVMLT